MKQLSTIFILMVSITVSLANTEDVSQTLDAWVIELRNNDDPRVTHSVFGATMNHRNTAFSGEAIKHIINYKKSALVAPLLKQRYLNNSRVYKDVVIAFLIKHNLTYDYNLKDEEIVKSLNKIESNYEFSDVLDYCETIEELISGGHIIKSIKFN